MTEGYNAEALIGSRVRLETDEGAYVGTIAKIRDNGKLTLKDIDFEQAGVVTKLDGNLHFFQENVKRIEFLNLETVKKKVDNSYLSTKHFQKPLHPIGRDVPSDEEIVEMGTLNKQSSFQLPVIDTSDWPNWTIIDEVNNTFCESIKRIKQASIISIGAEGVLISRTGELCWLTIMAQDDVYMFDICLMGKNAFDSGLSEILESQVEKVIHDCSMLNDCLFNQYKVCLRKNVFDTQVASSIAFQQAHGGEKMKHPEPLIVCLQEHLGLDVNKFPILWYRSRSLAEDQAIWRKRPLSRKLQHHAVAKVMHLFRLRVSLIRGMLFDFETSIDAKLNLAKEASLSTVQYLLKRPAAIQRLSSQPLDRVKDLEKMAVKDVSTDTWITSARLNYKYLRFSRDAWHGIVTPPDSPPEETTSSMST